MLRSVVIILYLILFSALYSSIIFFGSVYSLYFFYLFTTFPVIICSWVLAYFLYDLFNFRKVNPEGKAVLITGTSSGFGLELAKRLDKFGK